MAQAPQPPTLSSLVEMRTRTDVAVSQNWVIAAITSYVLWTLLAVTMLTRALRTLASPMTLLGVLGTLGLIASTGLCYLVFRLIDRQNKHSGREQALFSEIMNIARSRVAKNDLKTLLPLSSAEQDLSYALQRTHERSGVLWAMLSLIPYLGWIFVIIALGLLTEECNAHRRAEAPLLDDLDRTLTSLGSSGLPPRRRFSARNTGLYVIVSVLTLGVFSIFWMYLMIQDPETHFAYHSDLEESLLRALPDSSSQMAGIV